MFKLGFKKAEEPEVKVPTLLENRKSKRIPENHLLLFHLTTLKLLTVHHKKLWKMIQEMGIPDHLTCLLRKLYAGQEATVRTRHGTGSMDWFQIGKAVRQGCIFSPCLFNLYAQYIMRNAGLGEAQVESKFQRELSISSDMQMTPPLCRN